LPNTYHPSDHGWFICWGKGLLTHYFAVSCHLPSHFSLIIHSLDFFFFGWLVHRPQSIPHLAKIWFVNSGSHPSSWLMLPIWKSYPNKI
jgi:hypothetical protein